MYLDRFSRVLKKKRENIGGDKINGIVAYTTTNLVLMFYLQNI